MQLGKSLTVLLKAYDAVHAIDEDLEAFYTPSECYALAHRGDNKRIRQAERHACHVAGVKNMKQLRKAMRKAMGNDAWVYKNYGFVPY